MLHGTQCAQSWYLSNNYQYHSDLTDYPISSIHKEDVSANITKKHSVFTWYRFPGYFILFAWPSPRGPFLKKILNCKSNSTSLNFETSVLWMFYKTSVLPNFHQLKRHTNSSSLCPMVLKTSLYITKPHILHSPWNKVRELNAEYGVFFASVQGGEQAEWGTNTWAKLVNIVY